MTFLIKMLGCSVLILGLIITILAGIFIIDVELYEIFEVDVFHKIKTKVRNYAYGQKRKTEALGKLLKGRTNGVRKNRKFILAVKRKFREKGYKQKSVQEANRNTDQNVR